MIEAWRSNCGKENLKEGSGEREFIFNDIFSTVISGITRSTCIQHYQALLNQLPADRPINPCLAQRNKQITLE